ncbi:response regulator transcription factor [Luteipulveratus mongoliensis]|uniref:LuxR family transcriptional regulator n=1 Tax=Luteipulveratus mongoliensis TaxID=571913 RepID=A0A0K1JF77_9MICO|nr:response regulator transcription factor [Luteipulveratus mongoliensis]AKU15240.1 LuxR family transcriptional regulator [Luteipulveratus mongoliensis]
MTSSAPLRIAAVNDYDVVVAGLHAMLRRYARRVCVVELDTNVAVAQRVDIALYDTFAQTQDNGSEIMRLLRNPRVGAVVVYTWNFQPEVVQASIDRGVRGYVSKTLAANALVDVLEQVHAGEVVVSPTPGNGLVTGEWPGREEGLTPREAEVLGLITQGLSNNDIAAQTHLSINSVKSYIRTAYRKIEVTSRSQAVLWGVRHGFEPDQTRLRPPTHDGSTRLA